MTTKNGNGNDRLMQTAIADSVQVPPSVSRDGIVNGAFGVGYTRSAWLPPYGTRAREVALRDTYRMDEMALIRGAFVGVAKSIASLPWEIKGDDTQDEVFGTLATSQGWRLRRNDGVQYFQEVFRQANFGAGWGAFISQCVLDFLRYDAGGYIEVIAQGDAYNAPLGAITGLAHLDPIRTYPTGDPRYPAVYYDRWGGLHVLNHARVIRLLDMEDGDELRPGYGDSALSRAISIAMRQIWETRYINARLDDKPPPGLTVLGGITKTEWQVEQLKYQQQQQTDNKTVYGQRQFYHTADPAIMPKVESYEFSQPPEKFDFRTYVDIDVDILALAMGVDRQELMQLSGGGAIGSNGQSVILAQKSRGKTIGYLLQQIERKFNDLLPKDYTFEFKFRDTQEAMEDATRAQLWADVVAVTGTALSPNEQRVLLANQIEAVQDAISDAPRANDVYQAPQIAEDNTPGSAPVPVQGEQPRVNVDVDEEVGKAYNPSQPRGKNGRWVGNGSLDLSSLGIKVSISPKETALLQDIGRNSDDVLKASGLAALPTALAKGNTADITVSPKGNGVSVHVKAGGGGKSFDMERRIDYDADGKITRIRNDRFFLPNEYKGSGEGTRIFKSQVDALSEQVTLNKAGQYPQIETIAGRGDGMNGYYTWARLGYDAPVDVRQRKWTDIPSSVTPSVKGAPSPFNSPTYHVSDFMKSAEGREYWKANGTQEPMLFDLNPTSESMRVLGEYAQRTSTKSLKTPAPSGAFDIDIPEDEESILDAIWDGLNDSSAEKTYGVTEAAFVQDVTDLLKSASQPDTFLDRRGFNITMRSLLKRYGLQAYIDGLAQGGVYVDALEPDENADYMNIFVQQSGYIGGLSEDVYVKKSVSLANAYSRASMWGKSLEAFLNSGQVKANANAMYRWQLGVAEHCSDCQRLSGQVHRMKSWYASGWLPRASTLICHGFNCKCSLVRTTERAKGRF